MVVPARLRAGEVGPVVAAMNQKLNKARREINEHCAAYKMQKRDLNMRFCPGNRQALEYIAELEALQAKYNAFRTPLEQRIVDLHARIESVSRATHEVLAASLDRWSFALVNIVAGYLE
jgi:hypothetical protein